MSAEFHSVTGSDFARSIKWSNETGNGISDKIKLGLEKASSAGLKTIIAGSRDLEAYKDHYPVWLVADACIKSGFTITEVVCGGARGIDLAGKTWADSMGVPVKFFIPDWNLLGKRAGFVRNSQMADYANALILVWNGTSRGSAHMLQEAKRRHLKIYEYIIK